MLHRRCTHNALLVGGKASAVACPKRHVVMMWGSGVLHSPAYNGAVRRMDPLRGGLKLCWRKTVLLCILCS